MHSMKVKLKDGREAFVHHNTGWTGEAIIIVDGHEMRMPGEVLLAVGRDAAHRHVVRSTIGFLEQLDAAKDEDKEPPRPTTNDPDERDRLWLAATNPQELFRMIESGELRPGHLTFAAEFAGRVDDPDRVRRALFPLLGHESPLVREGAIYGLSKHMNDDVRARLVSLAGHDPSEGVREAARAVTEEPARC